MGLPFPAAIRRGDRPPTRRRRPQPHRTRLCCDPIVSRSSWAAVGRAALRSTLWVLRSTPLRRFLPLAPAMLSSSRRRSQDHYFREMAPTGDGREEGGVVVDRATLRLRPRRRATTAGDMRTGLPGQQERRGNNAGREGRLLTEGFDSFYVARRTSESRTRQGLPRYVEDPGTISRLRLLLSVAIPTTKEGRRSPAA